MIIKKGDRGDKVKEIQSALGLSADGVFGSGTEAAVNAFQKANGLAEDGLVGPNTLELMLEETGPAEIDLSKLKGHVPAEVIEQIPEVIEKFKIHTPLRLCHFLAQVAHESGNFVHKVENLNYSSKALVGVFGKYFDEKTAEEYQRQPERIANRVYANRMDNGDEASGDGWKFKGRGYIQLTGKHNYSKFNDFVEDDVLENPDLVANKYPLLSAGWFWSITSLNRIADQGSTPETVKLITKKVNGGYHGLEDRQNHFEEFYGLLS